MADSQGNQRVVSRGCRVVYWEVGQRSGCSICDEVTNPVLFEALLGKGKGDFAGTGSISKSCQWTYIQIGDILSPPGMK